MRDLTPRCQVTGRERGLHRETFGPSWSPDGARLAFTDLSYPARPGFTTVGADGRGERPIETPDPETAAGAQQGPSYAPDGARIVYERRRTLYTAAVAGGDERVLYGGPHWFTRPRWSPDGRFIVAERLGCDPCGSDGIWALSAVTGRPLRQLARGGHEPDRSPDSRRVVFRSRYEKYETRDGARGGNIFVARADGRGRPRRIVHRERMAESSPVWSPDGRYIAWISLRFTRGAEFFGVFPSIWRVPARGGHPKRLRVLPQPYVEEGFRDEPKLAWRPLP